jgi:hypothetical protein
MRCSRFGHDAIKQVVRTDGDVVEPESSHDRYQDATSSHDDARPFHWKAWVVHAVGEALSGKRAEDIFGGVFCEVHSVQS